MKTLNRFFSQVVISGKAILGPFDLTEFIFSQIGYTFLTLMFYCLLALYSTSSIDLSHWVIGNSLILCVNTCIFGLGGVFDSDRYFGRLKVIFIAPTNLFLTVVEKGVVSVLIAFSTVIVTFVFGAVIFQIDLSSINYLVFIGATFAASFSAAGLGLMLSAISLLSDSLNLLLNVVASITMLLSGANFPISQLPSVIQCVAKLFPLNRSISAAVMSYGGFQPKVYFHLVLGELLVGIFFYCTAVVLLKTMERLALKCATLELF